MKYALIICTTLWLSQIALCQSDTLINVEKINPGQTDTDDGYGIFQMFDGNPGKAALYSIIIPGAGQAYNKRWWKAPLFVGAEVAGIYYLIYRIDQFQTWDTEYRSVVSGNPPTINANLTLESTRRIRNNARQNKDYAWVILAGIHIIAAADAFVDRHLIEFDVEDDLEVSFRLYDPSPGLNLVINF